MNKNAIRIPIRLFGEDGKLLCQPQGYADEKTQYKTFSIPTLASIPNGNELPDPDELKVLAVQKQPDGNLDIHLTPDQMKKLATLIMGYEELLVRVVQGDHMRAAMGEFLPIMLKEIGHVPGTLVDWDACGFWMNKHIKAGMITPEEL